MSIAFDCTGCVTEQAKERCKQLRKDYETLGNTDMCKATSWPGARSKSDANGVPRVHPSLVHYKRHLKVAGPPSKRSKISLVHWSPQVIEWCSRTSTNGTLTMYIPKELGDKVGLTEADVASHASDLKLSFRQANFYHNVPSVSLAKAEEYVAIKKAEMGLVPSGTGRGNASSDKKRQLAEEVAQVEHEKQQKKKDEILDAHVKFITTLSQSQLDYLEKEDRKRNEEIRQLKQNNDDLATQNALLQKTIEQFDHLKLDASAAADILASSGGISRFTLLSPAWHIEHPTQCKDLFGFDSYEELQEYLRCFWYDKFGLDDKSMAPASDRKEKITEYEKCLITLMRFHRKVTLTHLGGIWGRERSRIGKYIYEWASLWGTMGRNLSILDVTEELLTSCMPKEFEDLKMGKVCVLVDGKVIMTEVCRSHNAIKRAMWNDKTHHDGVLFHAWIIPYGLSVEHTPLHLGRVTEGALVELWGKGEQYLFQNPGGL